MNLTVKACDGCDRSGGTDDIVFVRYSCVASLSTAMAALPWVRMTLGRPRVREGRRKLEEGVLEIKEACGRVNLVRGCS
jgi:hypothetical protein